MYRWLTKESQTFLERGYLLPGQSVDERVDIICKRAEEILKIDGFAKRLKDNFKKGWYSFSTPIWCNFGTDRGLPISCFNSMIDDTMDSIMYTAAEVGIMTKYGGGTSGYFGKLRERGSEITNNGYSSGPVHFMQMFDTIMNVTNQGSSRRGNFAAYLDIEHPDILEFLEIREEGNPIQDMSFGVCIGDEWFKSMIDGDVEKRKIWARLLQRRYEVGYPYIFFTDNVNNNAPDVYRDKGLKIHGSNLCVSGNTQILTSVGYQTIGDLENEIVDVWNGSEWSEVKVLKTGSNQKLLRITTDSGYELDCTPYHKFYIQNESNIEEVRAEDLKPGDILVEFELPVIEENVDSNIKWLEEHLQCAEKDTLQETQLVLQALGVNSKILEEKDGYKLLISVSSLVKLSKLGLSRDLLISKLKFKGGPLNPIKIKSVESLDGEHDTFCFNEPKKHLGMFNGILTGQCSEIALHSSNEESFVCNLSSMNILHYDEWKDTDAVYLLTFFLDAVMTEFIEKAKNIRFLERAVNFAERQRALGIGWLGWHSYLQSKMIPFESMEAKLANIKVAKKIKEDSYAASKELATLYGEPELMKGYGRRNVTTMAIAPTKSSAYILGQVSEGIEPIKSNYQVNDLAKTKSSYKNPYLLSLLEQKGQNTPEVWKSILMHRGSVQHLDFLDNREKDVFKTFSEISPVEVIIQAAQRQKYVDQSQSLNLMIHPDTPVKDLNKLIIFAWEQGVKTLYYQHSMSAAQELNRKLMECKSCEG